MRGVSLKLSVAPTALSESGRGTSAKTCQRHTVLWKTRQRLGVRLTRSAKFARSHAAPPLRPVLSATDKRSPLHTQLWLD